MKWYRLSVEEILEKNNCQPDRGLTLSEVKKRQKKYGVNELTQEKGPSLLVRFFSQFKDFMIITLLGAALISFVASYMQGETDLESFRNSGQNTL